MVDIGRFEVKEEKPKRCFEATVPKFLDGMNEETVKEEMEKILNIPQIAVTNQLKYSNGVHIISRSLG